MILNNAKMMESLVVLVQAEETGMLGYAIARNRQKLADEVREYSAKRDELLKKYGEDMGDGKFNLDPKNAAAFLDELRPYSELEADVSVMQVAPEVFCGGSLTSSQMFTLGWMVKDGE